MFGHYSYTYDSFSWPYNFHDEPTGNFYVEQPMSTYDHTGLPGDDALPNFEDDVKQPELTHVSQPPPILYPELPTEDEYYDIEEPRRKSVFYPYLAQGLTTPYFSGGELIFENSIGDLMFQSMNADNEMYHPDYDEALPEVKHEPDLQQSSVVDYVTPKPECPDIDIASNVTPRKTDDLRYQCQACDKIFKTKKGAQAHYVVHTKKRPHVCGICKKAFRYQSNLCEHRSVHDDYKRFACSICKRRCRLKNNLKRHMLIHFKNQSPAEFQQAWLPYTRRFSPHDYIP